MAKRFFLFLVLSILTISTIQAQTYNGPIKLTLKIADDLSIFGPAELQLVKAQTLTIKGSLNFSRLDVAQTADITGTVNGKKGKFGTLKVTGFMDVEYVICENLNVKGPVKADYLEVKNEAEIIGTLNAQNSKFHNLTISPDTLVLNNVTIDNITINKPQHEEDQVLILKGKTVVTGDILFQGGNGTITTDGPDVQIKGSIKGGKLKK